MFVIFLIIELLGYQKKFQFTEAINENTYTRHVLVEEGHRVNKISTNSRCLIGQSVLYLRFHWLVVIGNRRYDSPTTKHG